jgi:ubiquinone/menaquinone biosynthesis C-methylase UbiE
VSVPTERQARLAKLYDDEILPAYATRFAELALRVADVAALPPGARAVEVGCATGHLTRELGRRLGPTGRLTAIDESEPFLDEARAKIEADRTPRAATELEAAGPLALPVDDGAAALAVSNLAVAAAPDPPAAARELARVLAPGGRAVITAPLRGTWAEFLDLFREVLRESGKRESLSALDAYVHSLPDANAVARWLEDAGLVDARVEVARWEILFKSAREFFFAPLVELGPLPRWKQLSGRGDEMQDVFFFTKEAIDTYFKGRVFAVSILAGAVSARRPG